MVKFSELEQDPSGSEFQLAKDLAVVSLGFLAISETLKLATTHNVLTGPTLGLGLGTAALSLLAVGSEIAWRRNADQ